MLCTPQSVQLVRLIIRFYTNCVFSVVCCDNKYSLQDLINSCTRLSRLRSCQASV